MQRYSNMTTSFSLSQSLPDLTTMVPEFLQPLLLLSYPIPSNRMSALHAPSSAPQLYGKGPKDVLFVVFWAVAFTTLREVLARCVYGPFARRWVSGGVKGGVSKKEKRRQQHVVTRFSEQGWSFSYYVVFWSFGTYILYRTPNPLSAQSLWANYPHSPLPGLNKFYYLAQLGFWWHQLLVLNLEKRRNDHWQMLSHHIITITLMAMSYFMNFTRVGILILVLMDFCDILLPLAKMLRYLSLPTDLTFGAFLVSWLLTRQIGFFLVLLSTYSQSTQYIPYGWDPKRGYFWTPTVWAIFVGLLSALQVFNCIWFWMVSRVAYRVVKGLSAEDTRSDDEDEDLSESNEVELPYSESIDSTSSVTSTLPTPNPSPRLGGVDPAMTAETDDECAGAIACEGLKKRR